MLDGDFYVGFVSHEIGKEFFFFFLIKRERERLQRIYSLYKAAAFVDFEETQSTPWNNKIQKFVK